MHLIAPPLSIVPENLKQFVFTSFRTKLFRPDIKHFSCILFNSIGVL